MHRQHAARNGEIATNHKVQTPWRAYSMSRLLHLQTNVYTHLRITDKLPAGVGVPLQMEAAQTPLKERGNTGVRNAAETFSAISFTVLQD